MPTAMTIHSIDDSLYSSLATHAKREGKSLNQSVKDILATVLGVRKETVIDHTEDFLSVCGSISSKDAEKLRKDMKIFDRIDEEMWR